MLGRILPKLPEQTNKDLLVGVSTADDAGVFRLRDDLAIVQTVDFFTPIVDDPFDYGRIAAVNSLSDVYAMGGVPVSALNIIAFPDGQLGEDVLLDILRGGADVCRDAGVAIAGGHSVSDRELKYGLSVTGTIHPDRILTNGNAQVGDVLVLTKPLGSGLISNALMNNATDEESIQAAIVWMLKLNKIASEIAVELGAHSMTDITGFGLFGHALEMAKSSNATFQLHAGKIPAIDGAMKIAESGSFFSGGEHKNKNFASAHLTIDKDVEEAYIRLMSDPQTSGGLLIAFPQNAAEEMIRRMEEENEKAWIIGQVVHNETPALLVKK